MASAARSLHTTIMMKHYQFSVSVKPPPKMKITMSMMTLGSVQVQRPYKHIANMLYTKSNQDSLSFICLQMNFCSE